MAFTDNKNQQILQSLLKAHGVKTVVASPGGTNPAMVMSFQSDNDFTVYSSVDERSAAYMACGLSEELNEPVALCCTGATASRNYMPALTEAFYRKLPIVVITCSKPNYMVGHLYPQVTNRSVYPADVIVDGEQLQEIRNANDLLDVEFKVNKALIKMRQHGGGPVHFNVENISYTCNTKQLVEVNVIRRVSYKDVFPTIEDGKIAIFIGAHKQFSDDLQTKIDLFCESHNAVVLCDYTSGYHGKYSLPYSLIGTQQNHQYNLLDLDLLIHLGEQSGDYLTQESIKAKHVWRVSEDGEIRIRFKTLDYIFELDDCSFFSYYTKLSKTKNTSFYEECNDVYKKLYESIDDLPLSHMYIAKELAGKMPDDSVVHFSIINPLRSWNFFKLSPTIRTNCNVGGFGIDGCTSSLIGASLVNKNKLYYLISGDLAFFYDLNSLGNRHIGNNVRILLLNDGKGSEFTHYRFPKYEGDRELFIAAAGHYGNQSKDLIKHFATDLGFEYMQASSKEEFLANVPRFIDPKMGDKPMLFEVFASSQGQSDSWDTLSHLEEADIEDKARDFASKGIGQLRKIKRIIGK